MPTFLRRPVLRLLVAAAACTLSASAHASPVVLWTPKAPPASPPARSAGMMAYDAARGEVVLFGGYDGPTLLGDTWTWDGTTWTHRFPATSPPARQSATMAYDAARQRVVLFGGQDFSGTYFDDTWTWDGTTWTQQNPATKPPARDGASMAYDAARGRIVLFGGKVYVPLSFQYFDDTWTWNGTTWTQQTPAVRPGSRFGAAMSYDAAHGRVVLFGGNDDGSGLLADTWTWDGTAWAAQSPADSPPARAYAATAYDGHGRVVVFGGYGALFGDTADTWTWDGSTWSVPPVAAGPGPREFPMAAYDSGRGEIVLFGGVFGTSFGLGGHMDDTWIYADPAPA